MSEKNVTVQSATPELLAGYGELLNPAGKEPAFDNEVFSFWNDLSVGDAGEPVSFGMVVTKPGELLALMVERHVQTTETLVALDEDIILVLAKPSQGDRPDLNTILACRVPQGTGITLKKGTWHYVPLTTATSDARTLVVFRQGTPAEDLQVHDLGENGDPQIRVTV